MPTLRSPASSARVTRSVLVLNFAIIPVIKGLIGTFIMLKVGILVSIGYATISEGPRMRLVGVRATLAGLEAILCQLVMPSRAVVPPRGEVAVGLCLRSPPSHLTPVIVV